MTLDLAVILPVYNEEASVERVIEEWLPVLKSQTQNFRLIALDDGSRDESLKILRRLSEKHAPFIEVRHHDNRGHGQTCIEGYQYAISLGARWVFQIDSDGQCDPRYFSHFWNAKNNNPLTFGFRHRRDDGLVRYWISRLLAVACWMAYGVWVPDPNVPYRLMSASLLSRILPTIPRDFHLANVLVSLRLRQQHTILRINIHFRQRFGGSPTVKLSAFSRHGAKLFIHLLKLRWQKRTQ